MTVLITGTSSGIGLATAVSAARAGFATVATMRDLGRAQALRDAAARAGVGLDIRRLDVTDAESIAACVDGIRASYGHLDAVVNNAGISNFDPTLEMSTMEALRANLEVNFFGVMRMTNAVLPFMRARRSGKVINVSSSGGVAGMPFRRFIRYQVAGDTLFPADPDGIIATGFVVAGPWDFVGQVDPRA